MRLLKCKGRKCCGKEYSPFQAWSESARIVKSSVRAS